MFSSFSRSTAISSAALFSFCPTRSVTGTATAETMEATAMTDVINVLKFIFKCTAVVSVTATEDPPNIHKDRTAFIQKVIRILFIIARLSKNVK